jgi:hypothetical protein
MIDMENLLALLDTPGRVTDAPDARPLALAEGAVEFRDVSFSYERGLSVLKGVRRGTVCLRSILPKQWHKRTAGLHVQGVARTQPTPSLLDADRRCRSVCQAAALWHLWAQPAAVRHSVRLLLLLLLQL